MISFPVLLQTQTPPPINISYDQARPHELLPHRRTIPLRGVHPGFNQLHLTLLVSPTGDVLHAEATGSEPAMKFWPSLQGEVGQWRFTPFKRDGHPITAQVEEYVDLVPPERLPPKDPAPPLVKPTSAVTLTLQRSGCYGSCPAYTVSLSTTGILFEGKYYVVATGKHTAPVDPDQVRALAKRFNEANFYTMAPEYQAGVTDCPTYILTAEIDGHKKSVLDYVGAWEGMPAVVTDLEEAVDKLAQTDRWITGADGLVPALQAEKFNFATFQAQSFLKAAAEHGNPATVQQFLQAGVPLKPIPDPKPDPNQPSPADVGWLSSATRSPETLQILIAAGASRDDQTDKDLALVAAASSGSIPAVTALIDYGANPNADLAKLTQFKADDETADAQSGPGSVLISAAQSGNPELLRLLLQSHPALETHDREGKTALFTAVENRSTDNDEAGTARALCVRLLAAAGADVNARDNDGNTPLHETFLTDVEQALLDLGANVNARNNAGETPIFTTVDDDAIPLFAQHGADFNLRNNQGQTVLEAAEHRGPTTQQALLKALQSQNAH